jgi:hypothetical protein
VSTIPVDSEGILRWDWCNLKLYEILVPTIYRTSKSDSVCDQGVSFGEVRFWNPTVVELARSVLAISLGTVVSIVSHFTTSEASIATGRSRGIVPHRCTRRSALAILQKVGTLH